MEEIVKLIKFENFLLAPKLDENAQAAFMKPNTKLQHALSNSEAKGLPPISVRPLSGQYLTILTQLMGAKEVLEVGSLGGYSTICFAEAGAKVTSIEIDPKHHAVAVENVKGLDSEMLLGSSQDVMPQLIQQGRQFDLVFIDTDIDENLQWQQFELAVQLVRPGGCVFLDDVVAAMIREGHTEAESPSILTKIGQHERVSRATLVPSVTCHPMAPTPVFNGFVLAIVGQK